MTQFKQQLKVEASIKFGLLSRFLDTDRYDPLVPPVDPSTTPGYAALPEGAKHALNVEFNEDFKIYSKEKAQQRQDKPRLFGIILSALSEESKERSEACEEWGNVDSTMDPLGLWKLIVKTHSTHGDKANIVQAQFKAEQAYLNVRQGGEESLTAYKRRFTDAVRGV